MAGFKTLLKPSRILRQRALYRGLFGGDRFWLGLGAVMWVWKNARKMVSGGEPTTRYIEELKPGQRLVITNPDMGEKAMRKAQKKADKAGKVASKSARKDRKRSA